MEINENSQILVENRKFDTYRRRATKWGKCIMYIGYFLIITNSLSLFSNFIRLLWVLFSDNPSAKRGTDDIDPKRPFTTAEIAFGIIIDILSKTMNIAIGFLLIKST